MTALTGLNVARAEVDPLPTVAELTADVTSGDAGKRAEALRAVESVGVGLGGPGFDDALFSAARVVQDELADPARAMVLYQRIVDEYPTGRLAGSAIRRLVLLREQVGNDPVSAQRARTLAQLRAASEREPYAVIVAGVEELLIPEWPGTSEAALWLGEYERRIGQLPAAARHLQLVVERWPSKPAAAVALRELAGLALDQRRWHQAIAWAQRINPNDPADAALRDGVLTQANRGLVLDAWYQRAWWIAGASLLILLTNFAHSVRGSNDWRTALRPPLEVWFLLPIVALLYAASLTTNVAIAPAVLRIALFGIAAAWLVGGTLHARVVGRQPLRAVAIVLSISAVVGVLAVVYIALMRQGLLFEMFETLRFGPEL
ncbi:MAG: hypothetical protein KBG15_11410 [Kofleriaceae bacterium]|nr:hypothetical protein [Kofleriaceae bacterium]